MVGQPCDMRLILSRVKRETWAFLVVLALYLAGP